MRILLLAPASSIHTIRWAEAFYERGHDVNVVSLPNHAVNTDSLSEGISVAYLPFKGSKGYYLNALALRKYNTKFNPDVINAHFASGYGTLIRAAGLHPTVLNIWGSDIYVFPKEGYLKKIILKKNIRFADAVASTSECMAEELLRIMKNYEKKITITPFGVDVDRFRPISFNKNGNKLYFTVGIVKAFRQIYGIDCVIEAFYLFLNKWKKSEYKVRVPHLLIYGKGEDKEKCLEQIKRLQIEEYVELKDYIAHERVAEVINTFDVSCYGSRSESFGVSAIESMACEVPVVSTNADGLAEVIENGVTGHLVPIDDSEAMAAQLWNLYCDESGRVRMGQNGRKRVLELYNWEDNVMTLEKLLEETALQGDKTH